MITIRNNVLYLRGDDVLGRRISQARQRQHMTQQQVATRLGVARSTYANYERGKRDLDSKMLAKISEVLNISLDHLVLGDKLVTPYSSGFVSLFEPTDLQSISHIPVYATLYADSHMNLRGEALSDILISSKLFQFNRESVLWLRVDDGIVKSLAITKGSFVLLEVHKGDEVQGDIVAVCVGDRPAAIKRIFYTGDVFYTEVEDPSTNLETRVVQRFQGDSVILTSDDSPSHVHLFKRSDIRVIGKVIMVLSRVINTSALK